MNDDSDRQMPPEFPGLETQCNIESKKAKLAAPSSIDLKIENIESILDNKLNPGLIENRLANYGNEVAQQDQEIFIPIHGFLWLSPQEVEIINHPAFQRLGQVLQLGFVYIIFRGATHKRLEHSIGCLAVVRKIIRAVKINHDRKAAQVIRNGSLSLAEPLNRTEEAFTRLAALLHDIGHIPGGHTLEDELRLLPEHDSLHRLELVFDRTEWFGIRTESLRSTINRLYASYVTDGIDPSQVLLNIIAKLPDPLSPAQYPNIRLGICRDIVGNTICADLLDYLYRDWYHIGKPRHFETRLFQYMELRKQDENSQVFVISLGQYPKLRTDAITLILELLESRYQLCESVLFHPTKCSAAACFERGLLEIYSEGGTKPDLTEIDSGDLEKKLLDCSDFEVLKYFLSVAREHSIEAAIRTFEALLHRKVYKEIETEFGDRMLPQQLEYIQKLYTVGPNAKTNRLLALRQLETDFGLAPGSVVMYCPSTKMNAKIPEVRICTGDSIKTFEELERTTASSRARFTAGHISAQLDRFAKLWRIHFFIERTVLEGMPRKLRLALCDGIRLLLLRDIDTEASIEERVFELAERLSRIQGTPLYNKQVIGELIGTKGMGTGPIRKYPTGISSLLNYIEND